MSVPRRIDQGPSGVYGSSCMVCACQRRYEDPDRLIADEPVHDGVVLDEHVRRRVEESIHDLVDVGRSHRLAHRSRTSDVREHEAARDLGTTVVIRQLGEALAAELWVLGPASFADEAHEGPAHAAERRRAELAAGIAGQVSHELTTGPHPRLGACEDLAPQVVVTESFCVVHQPLPGSPFP
jgi:hypothetical protein